MKKAFKPRAVALILVFMMAISMVSCYMPETPQTNEPVTPPSTDNPSVPPSTDNSNPITPPTTDTEDSKPHVCVFGEWEIIKEATNTEDGLRERKCSCGKVEQEVIEASGKEYYIQYRNLKTAEYPTENGYNSKEGLLNLPVPEAEGYVFIGWYTASIGGELIDYIPEGSTKNYILYAHWDLVTYEITYKNVPNITNVTSYDIEDKLKLETPKWSGLVFTHWSDEDGNIYKPDENITALPERMSGDLALTANWKVLRNVATPATNGLDLINAYSSNDGVIYFIFELGTIEHIVLDNIHPDMYYKYEGMPLNLTLSKTVYVGEETAESLARTVSKSVSSTHSFSNASNWANEYSLSQKTDISIGTSINFGDVVSASIEGNFGWEGTDTNSYGHTSSREFSTGSSNETSNTVSSALTYKKEMTSEITENISVDSDLPSGYYAYVHAGNIRVFGIVTYEIATSNYYIDTYSRLDNMHSMIMYYSDVNQLNTPSVEGLDFKLPEEKILNFVNNSYFIKYDANGGAGTMPTTMHSIDGTEQLAKNEFTKEGCIFAGWELTTDDGVSILLDGQSVTNLANPLQTITLKAIWEGDPAYDKDVVYTLTTKTGYVSHQDSDTPECKYSVVIEYRNRTDSSVEIRMRWTSTISKTGYDSYRHKFIFNVGSVKASSVEVVPLNAWSSSSSARSRTGESEWITVPLNTSNATSISLQVYYWKEDKNGKDLTAAYGYSGVYETWTVNIPAN